MKRCAQDTSFDEEEEGRSGRWCHSQESRDTKRRDASNAFAVCAIFVIYEPIRFISCCSAFYYLSYNRTNVCLLLIYGIDTISPPCLSPTPSSLSVWLVQLQHGERVLLVLVRRCIP